METQPIFSTDQLRNHLETGNLFSKKAFDIEEWSFRDLFYIREVTTYCEICKQKKPFHNLKDLVSRRSQFFAADRESFLDDINGMTEALVFQCVSCDKHKQTYLLNYEVEDNIVTFVKAGEFPKYKRELNKSLSKFFAKDKSNYQKAISCLDRDFGIAAFAYLRRIIEDNINLLLKNIEESLGDSELEKFGDSLNEVKEAFDNLHSSSHMSSKIKVANFDLPGYLQPHGENPLGRLYGILSEGVHSMSDAQCMEVSEEVLACLTYLITSITNHKKEREEYLTSIRKLKVKKLK